MTTFSRGYSFNKMLQIGYRKPETSKESQKKHRVIFEYLYECCVTYAPKG